MKKLLITTIAAASILSACGQKEVIREVLVTTPPTTMAPEPELNKFDQYLEMLYNESAQARSWNESDLLELGTTVCEVFDTGGTIEGVINIFSQNSSGAYDDELFSAVIAGSVIYLCPEWADYVQSQLN
ncbi:MAG: DUF732 domain-containing protein [Snowella sp.]|nr:DUF732 domain-containing protein [Snowella sp.]